MTNRYFYGRVSTEAQSLNRQIDLAKKWGIDEDNIFLEKMTGAKANRPQLDKLRKEIKGKENVIIYIESLSRLGRSTKDLLLLLDSFKEQNITVISSKENIDTSTPTGKLLTTVLCALSEFERDLTVERTKAGLEASRARGRVGGRPPVNQKDLKIALSLYDSKEYSIAEICKRCNISQGTLYSAINKRKAEEESEK